MTAPVCWRTFSDSSNLPNAKAAPAARAVKAVAAAARPTRSLEVLATTSTLSQRVLIVGTLTTPNKPLDSGSQSFGAVPEVPDAKVACVTQQAPDLPGFVIVVDYEDPTLWLLSADAAATFLPLDKLAVLLDCETKVLSKSAFVHVPPTVFSSTVQVLHSPCGPINSGLR